MRINGINTPNPNFKMRLTKDVKKEFDNLKENTKDFYGTQSDEYKKFCNYYRILKVYCQNYVVGADYDEKYGDYPYHFKIKKNGSNKIAETCFSRTKEDLYSVSNLSWLALNAYANGKE